MHLHCMCVARQKLSMSVGANVDTFASKARQSQHCVFVSCFDRFHVDADTWVVNSNNGQPAIDRVQALADISCSALYAFALYKAVSLHTCAPMATSPNSAQEGTAWYHSPKRHPGPCSSVGMRRWTDRHADRHTDGRGHYISLLYKLSLASRLDDCENSFPRYSTMSKVHVWSYV